MAIGESVLRKEDPELLTGRTEFIVAPFVRVSVKDEISVASCEQTGEDVRLVAVAETDAGSVDLDESL